MHLLATTWQDVTVFSFWFSLAVLFFTFLGYPIAIYALSRLRARPAIERHEGLPRVTVVLAAYNESHRITSRLQNLLESDYPSGKLDILVVSDGSTDNTVESVKNIRDARIRVIEQLERNGKAHCLNVALAACESELIVFADCRQRFPADTIQHLCRHFADPSVGAVSGELMIDPSTSSTGGGVDAYWKLEKFIRFHEARFDSCIGCTGAVYAIRRKLFQPLPPDTILDDVVIPMRIAMQGFRVLFDPSARAYDPQSLEPEREKIRKRRTLGGNFQMLFRYMSWVLPWKNRLWWQLISHKYLRLAAPVFLGIMFVANACLLNVQPYSWLFLGQCAFYGCAIVGFIFPGLKVRGVSIPTGFVFLNLMMLRGFIYFLRKEHRGGWQTANG